MFIRLLLSLSLLIIGCGDGLRWDLNNPIYVDNQLKVSNKDIFNSAMQNIITIDSKGKLSTNVNSLQTITLVSTSGENCAKTATTSAFTHVPTNGIINVCESFAKSLLQLKKDAAIETARRTLLHEWGHELSNEDSHLPCPVDSTDKITDKSKEAIMTSAPKCQKDISTYTKLDQSYICNTGYTIHGICDISF